MSTPQRVVALLVAGLVAIAIFVVALNVGEDRGQATASATATASASPTAAATESASPEPSAPTDEEALAILAEIEAQVEAIRGLGPADIGPPDLITRAELRDELMRLFDAEYPPEERAADNIALRALGLLGPDQDIAELQLDMLDESVLGFYDDTAKRMVVVTDAGLDASAKVTYAHEYTHALQYAHLGVAEYEALIEDDDDRVLAMSALKEGDAMLTMSAWLVANLTTAEQIELSEMPLPDTSGIPSWMLSQLEFPYIAGQFFVAQLAGENPFLPDFTQIDAAFADPPVSTEQIIDPNAWQNGEGPMPVDVPDVAAALGAGWEVVDESPVGEVTIGILLEHHGLFMSDAGLAADGWGGDLLVVASGPDGAFALAWRLAWDTPQDASAFVTAYDAVVDGVEFPTSVTTLPSGEVLVVHASSQAIHDATADAAGD